MKKNKVLLSLRELMHKALVASGKLVDFKEKNEKEKTEKTGSKEQKESL